MKTNICFITALGAFFLSSCASPKFLSHPSDMGSNPYGSYIIITRKKQAVLKGELIAVDSSHLYILYQKNELPQVEQVPLENIKNYYVNVARSEDKAAPLVLFTLASFTHGFFFPFSLLVNVTTIVASSSDYSLDRKDISLHELHKYARFPQGLPPDYYTLK